MFISSCGGRKDKTALKINAFSLSLSSIAEGVIVIGKNKDTQEYFQEVIFETTFEKEVSKGLWTFFAYTWDGGSPLAGNLKCSEIIEKDLFLSSDQVNLSLNSNNCLAQSIFPPGGINTSPTPNYPYSWSFILCNPTSLYSSMQAGGCGASYTGQATGLRVIIPSLKSINDNSQAESSCFKLNSGAIYSSNIHLPVLLDTNIDLKFKTQVYYSPTGNSCTGDCCTGKMDTYNFFNGPNEGTFRGEESTNYSNFGNYFLFKERVPPRSLKFDTSLTNFNYNTCTPIIFEHHEGNAITASSSSFNFTPTCSGTCSFYPTGACSSAMSTFNFPNNSSTFTIYALVNSIEPINLSQLGDGAGIGGDTLSSIPVSINYGSITAPLLNSITSLNLVGTASASPANLTVGSFFVYQTVSGNRGKFIVNNRTTSVIAGDILDFSFMTWDNTNTLVASGTNITSTACFSSGDCFLDFDINAGKLSPSNIPGSTDVWWENLSGTLYFNPQSGAPFRLIGP